MRSDQASTEAAPQTAGAAGPGGGPEDVFPLSFAQEQLWFLDRLAPGQRTYNIPVALRLRGGLDAAALRGALAEIVRRHETLRTTVTTRDGEPVQVIAAAVPVELPVEPLPQLRGPADAAGPGAAGTTATGMPVPRPDDRARAEDAAVEAALAAEAAQPFDLETSPLFRARLFRVGPEDHVLSLVLHHIVSDGWSTGVLLSELTELYAAGRDGRAPSLPDLPVQYADFAVWQRTRLQGAALERELDYWATKLAGAPVLELPTDRPRPPVPTFRGEVLTHQLPAELADRLRELARAGKATLFMTLMAGFDVLLARYTGQQDIVIGTASAGRLRRELEPLIGFFTNMIVLRTDLSGDPAFTEVLARVRETTLGAYEHQEIPFEKVVQRVGPARDPSRNPLFQVGIGLLPPQLSGGGAIGGLGAEVTLPDPGGSRFDLGINVLETPGGLTLQVEYATDLFDRQRIQRMLGHFERVLTAVAADPSVRLSAVPVLSEPERADVLERWQGPPLPYPDGPVHAVIAEQVAAHPDAVCCVFQGETLSYAELDRRAGLLARYLRSIGVRHEDVVGIALDRGLDVPVALLAVLAAGAAFLPLDASHPQARLDLVLADAGAQVVLTTSGLADRVPAAPGRRLVRLDEIGPELAARAGDPLPEWAAASSAAYVLYTSGSTGTPKGVVIEHGPIVNFTRWMGGVFGIGPDDRMLQFASLVFDLSEGEIFTALTHGAALVLVPQDTTLDPAALAELARRERVTYLGAPPALLGLLEPEPYPQLRGILVGGEAFTGELVNRWNLPGRTFVNGYGPTEVTIGCTYYACEHKTWASSPPIGRAMPNRRAYVVDRWGNPQPVGVPGEILVGGHGLARGYRGRPELTNEVFVTDPFRPGERAYRTGDLGMWTEQGQIQFLGRIDTQVKLRGQRIELEEIETVLARHPDVGQAVVALREDTPGDKRLVGYLVARPGAELPGTAALRDHLAAALPPYMIPAAFVPLPALPLSVTGKVDRAALPAPEAGPAVAVPPRTETEVGVAEAFADVLGIGGAAGGGVGADGDFFALGGNSLQAALVLDRIRDRLGVSLPLRDFYTAPTVAAVAAAAAAARGAGAGPARQRSPLVAVRPDGSRPPLFCVHNVAGSAYMYLGVARHLHPDQPLYAFESPGLEGDQPPLTSMEQLADHYLAALRERQPAGPYHLAGHSMGALVAFELARRLVADGEQVALLGLIDGSHPEPRPPAPQLELVTLFLENLAGIAGRPVPRVDPALGELAGAALVDALLAQLRAAELVPAGVGADFVAARYAVFAANANIIWGYRPPGPYAGRTRLILAEGVEPVADGWRPYCPDLHAEVVPGGHYGRFAEPYLGGFARHLQGWLDDAMGVDS
jgi:amino acid adenylation domain-containing protein